MKPSFKSPRSKRLRILFFSGPYIYKSYDFGQTLEHRTLKKTYSKRELRSWLYSIHLGFYNQANQRSSEFDKLKALQKKKINNLKLLIKSFKEGL